MNSTISALAIATSASNCDRSTRIQLLSDPKIYEQKLVGYRFKATLVSKALELDGWENPVPKDTKIIDIVVTKPTRSAIEQLIAACEWLQGYELVSFWQPEDPAPF
jgi:hypothetical protein